MLRILLPVLTAITACSPSPQEISMHNPGPPRNTSREPADTGSERQPEASANLVGQIVQGPVKGTVPAADAPAPADAADSSAAALGRRTLSTAFVMIGPDRHLTVDVLDGRTIVLRDVVMHAGDYCGVQVRSDAADTRYCGGYADVVAARPGGSPTRDEQGPAMADPVAAERTPVKGP